MNIWLLLGVVLVIFLCSFFYRNKLVIHFKTFFRKGFKLNKDKYGVFCFTGKQRFSVKHIALLISYHV